MLNYSYNAQTNFLRLNGADGGKLMELPLNARFQYNGKDSFFSDAKTVTQTDEGFRVWEEGGGKIAAKELKLTLLEDSVLVEFRVQAAQEIAVWETELFRAGTLGITSTRSIDKAFFIITLLSCSVCNNFMKRTMHSNISYNIKMVSQLV